MKKSISIKQFMKEMQLRQINSTQKNSFSIDTADINRPGLQFSGYFDYFAHVRVQVVGMVEMTYIRSTSPAYRQEIMETYFSHKPPCVIIARGLKVLPEMLEAAKKYDVPIFSTRLPTTKLTLKLVVYLAQQLAPSVTRHGVLIDVYGVGIFLTGDSGIGKSETALELVKRGHRLVADDVVEITRVSEDRITGTAPELVRYLMEIRGIGLIDVRNMYGIGSVILSKSIELVVKMEMWDENKQYDRLGLVSEYTEILDLEVPLLTLPVRPGRNLAIVIEVAARNFTLKNMGYNTAVEFDKRVAAQMKKK